MLVIGKGSSGKAAAALAEAQGRPVEFADGVGLVVASPGVRVMSELEYGCRELKRLGVKMLAVTGSKGKSSVVKLVADALNLAGFHATPCGNYGLPVSELALSLQHAAPSTQQWAVVEVSSFMLETTNLPPGTFEAAAILNLQEDHLDRHGSVEVYHALKRRLLAMTRPGEAHDMTIYDGHHFLESVCKDGPDELYDGSYFDNPVLSRNALAACFLLFAAGVDEKTIRRAFLEFEPLPHRMETVGLQLQSKRPPHRGGASQRRRPENCLAHLDREGQKSVSYRAMCGEVSFRLVRSRRLRGLRYDGKGCRGCEARRGEGRYGAPFAWNREFRPVSKFRGARRRLRVTRKKRRTKNNMNKLGIVLGIAAVAVIAGCKDPNYQRKTPKGEASNIGSQVEQAPEPDTPVVVEEKHCTCPPGTKHAEPCQCGAPDCQCIVEQKIVEKKDVKPLPPPEPEYTVYIVQRGDYLAKISKKYNVTINSIKRLNNLKDDNIRIGQKLKLPGKIEIGEQKVPEGAFAKPQAQKPTKTYAPYTGATKEYVVKSGDTLGAIAYGNGINIRQLKELNGLTSDSLKISQKLKIPAEKVAAKKVETKPVEKKVAEPEVKEPAEVPAETVSAPVEPTVEAPVQAPVVEESAPVPTYTVQEGDDLTDVSIRFGVSAAAVRELNNLGENDKLVAGQILKLPAEAQQQ